MIFRRNYMDINDFQKTDKGWVFEEKFMHYGNKCYFKMFIHGENFFCMYDVNSKTAKIKGKKNSFGVFIRAAKQKAQFEINRTCGEVEFTLRCEGKSLAYDNGKGIVKTREEKNMPSTIIHSGSRVTVGIPNSVSWNVTHPFSGGGVSPR